MDLDTNDWCWKSFCVLLVNIHVRRIPLQILLRAIMLIKYLIFASPFFQYSLTILFKGNSGLRLAFEYSNQMPWKVSFPVKHLFLYSLVIFLLWQFIHVCIKCFSILFLVLFLSLTITFSLFIYMLHWERAQSLIKVEIGRRGSQDVRSIPTLNPKIWYPQHT